MREPWCINNPHMATSIAVISPTIGTIIVAFSTSFAMSLPISTPPNTIAFATGTIYTRKMVKTGTIVSIMGVIALILFYLDQHSFFKGIKG